MNKTKGIIKLVFIIFLSIFLSLSLEGCKGKKLFKEEYVLIDDNGVIKCENFDYVICLEKEKGKDFVVLNLADVQLTDEQVIYNNGIATYAYELMDTLIEETKPDLITLSGDQGYGEAYSINAIAEVINKHNIPWAYVFGNHDMECSGLSIDEQVELYSSYSNCIGKYGPEEAAYVKDSIPRAGNYIINIVERDNDSFYIVRSIFMLNTGNKMDYFEIEGDKLNNQFYDHLNDNQLEFYKWGLECAKKYNNGVYPKSTIIEHIPIAAYAFAFAEAFNSNYTAYQYNQIHAIAAGYLPYESERGDCWKEGYKDSFGVCHEVICCSPIDDHIFEVLKEYGSTDSMLVGHDHKNNFSISYQGIRLTFSTKTGYGSQYESQVNGGTILIITEDSITFKHIYK